MRSPILTESDPAIRVMAVVSHNMLFVSWRFIIISKPPTNPGIDLIPSLSYPGPIRQTHLRRHTRVQVLYTIHTSIPLTWW